MKKIICLIIACGVILASCATSDQVRQSPSHSDSLANPGSALVRFYRGPLNHLSAVRYGECPMHPSCSEYSLQAFEKYGPVIGWMMTCDRLMRCGRDELRLSPKILVNGKRKCHDPLEANEMPSSSLQEDLPFYGQQE